jgi:hypothetical protein
MYVRLTAGLNNILVPREEFLESAFGAGVLTGIKLPYPGSNPKPPILGDNNASATTAESDISSYGGSQVNGLEAYWQNRAISPVSGGNFSTQETGTSNSSTLQIRAAVVTNPAANNSGGFPSDPSLLNASNANAPTAAMQSVITLNITSVATFDLLLSALITNSTGGSNGSLLAVTNQVPFLGLEAPVVRSLANATITTDGLYGYPQGQAPPPTPASSSVWGWIANAAVAVATNPLGALVSLVGVVYNYVVAGVTFFAHLQELYTALDGILAARLISGLQTLGRLINSGLDFLLTWLSNEVTSLISAALQPIESANSGYFGGMNSAFVTNYNQVNSGHRLTGAQASGLWSAGSGGEFGVVGALSAVASVALTILSAVSLGATFIIPILIGLLISGAGKSSFGGLIPEGWVGGSGTGTAFINAIWAFVNATAGGSLGLKAEQWLTWGQQFGFLLSLFSLDALVGAVVISAMTSSFFTLGLGASIAALIFGVFSLLAYSYYLNNGQTQTGLQLYSVIAGALAVGSGIAGLKGSRSGVGVALGLLGAGMGGAGIYLSIEDP